MRISLALLGVVVFADMLGGSSGVKAHRANEVTVLDAAEVSTVTALPDTNNPIKTIDGKTDTFWQCGPMEEGMDYRFLRSKNDSSERGNRRGHGRHHRRHGKHEYPRCSVKYHFYHDQYIEKVGIELADHGDGSTHNPNLKIRILKDMDRDEYVLISPENVHEDWFKIDLQPLAHRPAWEYLTVELLGVDHHDFVGIKKVKFYVVDDYSDDYSDSDDRPVRNGGKGKHRKNGKGGDKKNRDDESSDGKRPKKGGKRKDSEEGKKKGRMPKNSRDKNGKKDDKSRDESPDGKPAKKGGKRNDSEEGGKKGRKPRGSKVKNGKNDDKKGDKEDNKKAESRDGKRPKKGGKKGLKPKNSGVKNDEKDDKSRDESPDGKRPKKGGKSKRGKSKGGKNKRNGKPEKKPAE